MLNIIICEDDEHERIEIEDIIKKEIKEMKSRVALVTGEPKDVIKFIEASAEKNFIYFLDVDLGSEINGIELGQCIRKIDPTGYIIFVTAHEELTELTFKYKVQALDYIIKGGNDNINNKIKECILEAYNHHENVNIKENNSIAIDYGNNIAKVKFKEILFFETTGKDHKIRLHGINEQLEFYDSLKNVEKLVSKDFYRCHKSFLVNTRNIKAIHKEKLLIEMVNGQSCYVSAFYLKGLIKKWAQ